MSYPDKPIEGRVDSLGWGIAQDDGSTGFDLHEKKTGADETVPVQR